MNPVELIHHLVARTGESQKHLALAWLEAWNATAARPLAIATAQPRFSNLMKDELDGWKFFFGDPRRGDALLRVLQASDDERQVLIEGAAAKLASHADARMVVDLHDLDGKVDAILDVLVRDVLTDRRLVPVMVLVSPTQYGQIPMAFADLVRLVQVSSDEDAARELAQRPAALVLATLPPRDPDTGAPAYERWAAIAWDKRRLAVEPPDALSVFAEVGHLAHLPLVEPAHRLDRLGIAPSALAKPLSGPALRLRMLALVTGTLDAPASERLCEANAYGILAASTEEERVRAALSASGFPPEVGETQAGLERALARAAQRPGVPLVLRVGADWHLLNAEVPDALREHSRVFAHRFDARATPVRRLADAIASRTAVDWELDPHLHNALAELDPDGKEMAALKHARAWLVYGGHCQVGRPVPVGDGMAWLRRVLARPAPVAELRLRHVPTKTRGTIAPHVYSLSDPSVLERDVWAQVPGVGETHWHRRENRLIVAAGGDARPIDHPMYRSRGFSDGPSQSPWVGAIWEGHHLVPPGSALDDDAWLDAWESRRADSPVQHLRDRHEARAKEDRAVRLHRPSEGNDRDGVIRLALHLFDLPEPPWSELDVALVMAWSALGRATSSAQALRVHDGRFLLPITPGLLAELRFSAAPTAKPCRAAFEQQLECDGDVPQGWTRVIVQVKDPDRGQLIAAFSPLFVPAFAWEATGGTRVGALLPAGLHIVGDGVSCVVRFAADPYGLSDYGPGPGPSSLRAEVFAAAEAARRVTES